MNQNTLYQRKRRKHAQENSVAFFQNQANPLDRWTRKKLASSIAVYQRYLSPLKGYSCAHRVLYGGESCSQYVKRMILERGLVDAVFYSRQRFQDCKSAYFILTEKHRNIPLACHGDCCLSGPEHIGHCVA
ncbi:membrane protein insertion efficiency factor YidD [Planktothricoides raciborskii]|uniref:Membrane protein insertion efficiency factor YidD n=1 Tax=Planktothricoides raciborskii FACHB-1370 TaxID=2949576 RepID=A0ABR8EA58_9CYAN|nr:membrane protein insertion efficiency factor YidD [Planktothricoides raciborskii]MBD2542477.1 membrane protein insertion efficiency factor YidD [Planktothricoides raciborskii FACHB-1370]MBD2585797.1 membrane protein insertion efficiency factor YidD [Planktothricoides raciborskii FACHB-1261]